MTRGEGTEFTLFAPRNTEAQLLGSFTKEPLPMEKGDDGVFRAQVELPDGRHTYKFRVRTRSHFLEEDAWVEAVDPYATEVTYEDGPAAVARVVGGRRVVDCYEWRHDAVPLLADDELVIYELLVPDFSGGEAGSEGRGRFEDVTAKLDYLAELGVNALQLMPVNEAPGEFSWGYLVRHYFAAETNYGSSEQLKALIDACHERGMRVILDLVLNHSEQECPLTKIDYDYWYRREPKDPEHSWGPEFDLDRVDERLGLRPAWNFLADVVRFWIGEYHIDGIRFDAVKQLQHREFMDWIAGLAKDAAGGKPFINIAEHIPDTPEMVGVEGPFDACWHDAFLHTLVPQLVGGELDLDALLPVLDPRLAGYASATDVVNYLENHDQERLLRQLTDAGVERAEALARTRLGATLLVTAPGLPMLWMGQEFGVENPRMQERNPIDWTLLAQDEHRALREHYLALIALRREERALTGTEFELFHHDPGTAVFAFVRWDGAGGRVATVANFSGRSLPGYVVPNAPADGTWRWLGRGEAAAEGGNLTLDLEGWEGAVLIGP